MAQIFYASDIVVNVLLPLKLNNKKASFTKAVIFSYNISRRVGFVLLAKEGIL